MELTEKKISRLILKEDDVLVLHLPVEYFNHKRTIISIYRQIREKLISAKKNNKILMIPNDISVSVIGNEEVKEHVSNMDLWYLWSDEEELE